MREKYKNNQLFQALLEQGKKLKSHNIAMIVSRVKASYKSFFTKVKNGDAQARPPKPKKLASLTSYSLPLEFNAWMIKKKDHIKLKSDRELVCLRLTNTDSDKTSVRV